MNRRLYVCIVLLLMIVCSSGSIQHDDIPEPSTITFSSSIKNHYANIHKLIRDSLSGKPSPYQFPVFELIRKYGQHGLHFKTKDTTVELGGETTPDNAIVINRNLWIRNIIFLNAKFLNRGCKEYIVQVITHESLHAFIKWCKLSYREKSNDVDQKFLNKYFHNNWEWFTWNAEMTQEMEHVLMYRNYYDVLRNCIYEYTDRKLRYSLRDSIARALAWGGLEQHVPEWKNERDTCFINCINTAATNFNAPSEGPWFGHPDCDTGKIIKGFLDKEKDIFQFTKPVVLKTQTLKK